MRRLVALVAAAALACVVVDARPMVRSIKDQREFDKLLAHHAANTGLPVVADFYSDGCGPCRMMEPIFKALAKEYEGRAVFVKVDTAVNRALGAKYRVNSIPTFFFFGADGKLKNQFPGAGEQQLRQFTKAVVEDAEKLNVKLTLASLVAFYELHDPAKSAEDVAELFGKCAKLAKSANCEGGPAFDLTSKLKKKYKAKPTLGKRGEGDKGAEGSAGGGGGAEPEEAAAPPPRASGRRRAEKAPAAEKAPVPATANLDLASLSELEAAVRQRRIDLGLPIAGAADSSSSSSSSSAAAAAEEKPFDPDAEEEEDEEEEEENWKCKWASSGNVERVVVVGSGPAGLAAAIYAARAGLKPVVVAPYGGGQLMGKGVDVENYPGLLEQTGPGVVNLMLKQAASFGTCFEEQQVVGVDLSRRPFVITTNASTLAAHSLIIATGADSRWLGIPGEWGFRGGGVSSCATCDGFLFRDQAVVVIGGGDTAMEDALVLARTSSHVTVIHRKGSFRASHAMAQRVLAHPKISVLWHSVVTEFSGTEASGTEGQEGYVYPKLSGVVVATTDPTSGEVTKSHLAVGAAFVAIGHVPNTQVFAGQLAMGGDGYLEVQAGSTRTSVEGVFAAGDVADHVYRQAITSAGSGAMAALDAERFLSASGLGDAPAAPAAAAQGEL